MSGEAAQAAAANRSLKPGDDEEIDVKRLDALRVGPSVARGFVADGEALELLVFSPSAPGDAELVADFFVIAGLDPPIHTDGTQARVFARISCADATFSTPTLNMDHRVKPGGDDVRDGLLG